MTTYTEINPSDRIGTDRRDELERLFGELRGERQARHAEEQARARKRRTLTGFATAALVAAVIGGGAALIITDHSSAAAPQSAPEPTPAALTPASSNGSQTIHPAKLRPSTPTAGVTTNASNLTPSKPNPEIPSGNNIGNMGTGGGPTQINPQIPSGNNTGNMGTGGGPVS
jgi:cytoskeletal protein RodZ